MDHLHFYTRELMRDVAEAKRVGGRAITHLPEESRISASDMRTAATQLLPYGIHGYRIGNTFRVTWNGSSNRKAVPMA